MGADAVDQPRRPRRCEAVCVRVARRRWRVEQRGAKRQRAERPSAGLLVEVGDVLIVGEVGAQRPELLRRELAQVTRLKVTHPRLSGRERTSKRRGGSRSACVCGPRKEEFRAGAKSLTNRERRTMHLSRDKTRSHDVYLSKSESKPIDRRDARSVKRQARLAPTVSAPPCVAGPFDSEFPVSMCGRVLLALLRVPRQACSNLAVETRQAQRSSQREVLTPPHSRRGPPDGFHEA